MEVSGISLVFLSLLVATQALSPVDVLSRADQTRIRALFENGPYPNVATLFYASSGLKTLGLPLPQSMKKQCQFIQDNVDFADLPSIYYASEAAKSIGCKVSLSAGDDRVNQGMSSPSDLVELTFAVLTKEAQGIKYDAAEVAKTLDATLKKDDSILGTSTALVTASYFPNDVKVDKYFELVEDIVAQADTLDDTYLQFETLQQASVFVHGSYMLAARVNKKPLITEEQVVQLSNYILTRKSTQNIRNAFYVVMAIRELTNNAFQVPVAFKLDGSMAVSSADPSVDVKVSDLMENSLGAMTLKADASPRDGADEFSVTAKSSNEAFNLNIMQSNPAPGFYTLSLSGTPDKASSKLIGLTEGELVVKVTTEVSVKDLEIAILDRDQSITAKTVKVNYPDKSKTALEADHLQNVVVKFNLKNKAGESMTAHQTFIRVVNTDNKQEVVFTAESDSANTYKFTLDVADSGKEFFNQKSGKYTLQLIVGDAVIQNPIAWDLSDINLKFPDQPDAAASKPNQYAKKPNIEHLFRVPEKRPPAAVSTAFTFLVAAPLLLLLIFWIKLGANIKNFSFSLSALGFHGGLGAIFGLFYLYWAKLNMFQTLQYLAIIGIVTFLCGHRLLSSIANKKN